MAPKDQNSEFTPKELQNLALGLLCMSDGKIPPIDYDKFAELAGYTRASASVTWGKLCNKVKAKHGSTNTDSPAAKSATKKKSTPAKTKPMATSTDDGDEDTNAGELTPVPAKKRKAPSKASPVKKLKTEVEVKPELEAEDDGELFNSIAKVDDNAKIQSDCKMTKSERSGRLCDSMLSDSMCASEEDARVTDLPSSQQCFSSDALIIFEKNSPGFDMAEWIHEEYIVA